MISAWSGSKLFQSGSLFWRQILVLIVAVTLAGCGSQDDSTDSSQVTIGFKFSDTLLGSKVDLAAGTLTLTVTFNGNSQTQTIAPGATDVTINLGNVPEGSTDFTILFTYERLLPTPIIPLVVARATKTIVVVKDVNTPLSFVTADFETAIFDEDGDGLSNLVELDENSTTDPTVPDTVTNCVLGTSLLGSCTLGP